MAYVATFNGVSIGNEDCWASASWAPGKQIIVVHGQYTSRTGSNYEIAGSTRKPVEDIGLTLGSAFKAKPLVEYGNRDGIPLFVGAPDSVKAELIIPFSGNSYTDCYCVSVNVTDEGHRFALLDLTFEKPLPASDGSAADTVDFTWGAVNLGNQPGTWAETVDNSFIRYTVSTAYNGASKETYLASLSSSLGLDKLFLYDIPRGAPGSRGIVKSYSQTDASLTWVSKSVTVADIYPESLTASQLDNGAVAITATFVKAR